MNDEELGDDFVVCSFSFDIGLHDFFFFFICLWSCLRGSLFAFLSAAVAVVDDDNDWLFGWLVGRSVGRMIGRMIGCLFVYFSFHQSSQCCGWNWGKKTDEQKAFH